MDKYGLSFADGFTNIMNDIVGDHGQISEGIVMVDQEVIPLVPVSYIMAYITTCIHLAHEVDPQIPVVFETFHTDDNYHNVVVTTVGDIYQMGINGIKEIAG